MTRKTADWTCDLPGRDAGKVYVMTEKPAFFAQMWIIRLLRAAMAGGMEISEAEMRAGLPTLFSRVKELLVSVPQPDAHGLIQDLMSCVKIKTTSGVVRDLVDSDIEEVQTLFALQWKVLELHAGFTSTSAPLI